MTSPRVKDSVVFKKHQTGIAKLAIGIASALIFTGATAASAAAASPHTVTQYQVVKESAEYGILWEPQASCNLGSSSIFEFWQGKACTIPAGTIVKKTVDLALDVPLPQVLAALNMEADPSTVSLDKSCTAPGSKTPRVLHAYAVGMKHTYKVIKRTYEEDESVNEEVSDVLHAFDPDPTNIICRSIRLD